MYHQDPTYIFTLCTEHQHLNDQTTCPHNIHSPDITSDETLIEFENKPAMVSRGHAPMDGCNSSLMARVFVRTLLFTKNTEIVNIPRRVVISKDNSRKLSIQRCLRLRPAARPSANTSAASNLEIYDFLASPSSSLPTKCRKSGCNSSHPSTLYNTTLLRLVGWRNSTYDVKHSKVSTHHPR